MLYWRFVLFWNFTALVLIRFLYLKRQILIFVKTSPFMINRRMKVMSLEWHEDEWMNFTCSCFFHSLHGYFNRNCAVRKKSELLTLGFQNIWLLKSFQELIFMSSRVHGLSLEEWESIQCESSNSGPWRAALKLSAETERMLGEHKVLLERNVQVGDVWGLNKAIRRERLSYYYFTMNVKCF